MTGSTKKIGDLLATGSLMAFLDTRTSNCEIHGEYESDGKRFLNHEFWTPCPDCDAEEKRKKKLEYDSEMERMKRDRIDYERRKIEERLGRAAIPKAFIGRSLDNYVVCCDASRKALGLARKFVETISDRMDDGGGLIFSGSPGTGKSHLAAAIMQALIPEYSCLYTTVSDIILDVRDTWSGEKSTKQIIEVFTSVDLLTIDEVGAQYGTDSERNTLHDILDKRYRDKKPVIVITNQTGEGFRACLGDPVLDRLKQRCILVPFNWPSYRNQLKPTWGDV